MKPTYKIATVHVSGTEVRVVDLKPITRGITGAVVEIIYNDPLWAGLTKKVAFEGVTTVEDTYEGSIVPFPAEVATKKNKLIRIGITGVNVDEVVVIPTRWADLVAVSDSAYGDHPLPGEPTPPLWAQLKAMIGQLPNLDTDAKNNLVAAINELAGKIGDLKNLTTDARDNLVNAINEAAKSGSGTAVYILTEGETIEDAPEDATIVIDPFGEAEDTPGTGTPGEDGGYYAPEVTQPDASTAQFSFTPSKEGMAEVPPVSVTLPKGKDGKDGVIALTGASVGQIAKIAAVDENGVPTAWEPVEMPSWGEAWKLLRSFALPDDPSNDNSGIEWLMCTTEGYTDQISSFAFDTDMDGNPFSIREIIMYAKTGYGRSANYFGLADQNGSLGYGNLFCNRQTLSGSATLAERSVHVRTIGTHAIGFCSVKDNYNGNAYSNVITRNDEDITTIKYGTFGDSSILPGSAFEFWGR